MHDAKGRPLAVGDTVLIPVKITQLSPSEEYCNVSGQSVLGRRPDESKESFGGINTAVMLRNNPGDTNDVTEYQAKPEPAAEEKASDAPAPAAETKTDAGESQ